MTRRPACVILLVCAAAVAGCESKSGVGAGGATQTPSRATLGEFSDNPLLAFVPAETPYAFASFRPYPIELIRKMTSAVGPIWRRAFEAYLAQGPGDSPVQQRVIKDVLDALDTIDVKTFEAHGFSAQARAAIYGLGAYPAFRVELLNGDRVFELVRRTAERWNQKLPPPVERAARRYWIIDGPEVAVFVAIAPKELVFALGPRSVLDANLAQLLGEQRPANAMTTAQFRALAERHAFTGHGVGFVDLVRVGALIADTTGAAPDCRAAVATLAKRAPRLAFGYGEVTLHQLAYGAALDLAPDLIADVRGLQGSLAGLDRLRGQRPAMAIAMAGNLERGRTLLGRVAGAVQELGQRCELPDLVEGAAKVADVAGRPLPPVVAGLRGGLLVLNKLTMGPRGPQSIEGFGSVQLDHAGELLKLASSEMPDLAIQLDGKAHALPPAIPFPGHVAASESAIGFALGADSAGAAVAALQGKPAPAPLLLMMFDYGGLGDLIGSAQAGAEAEAMRALFKAFGRLTMQVDVDERGVVMSSSLELR